MDNNPLHETVVDKPQPVGSDQLKDGLRKLYDLTGLELRDFDSLPEFAPNIPETFANLTEQQKDEMCWGVFTKAGDPEQFKVVFGGERRFQIGWEKLTELGYECERDQASQWFAIKFRKAATASEELCRALGLRSRPRTREQYIEQSVRLMSALLRVLESLSQQAKFPDSPEHSGSPLPPLPEPPEDPSR